MTTKKKPVDELFSDLSLIAVLPKKIGKEWECVLIRLGLTSVDIEHINHNHTRLEEKIKDGLDRWNKAKTKSNTSCWERANQFLAALRDEGNVTLADEIEDEYYITDIKQTPDVTVSTAKSSKPSDDTVSRAQSSKPSDDAVSTAKFSKPSDITTNTKNITDYGSALGENEDFSLRGYQREIAQVGLAGDNSIIWAGTGSGKTWVAVYIMRNHLHQKRTGRIAFFTTTVTLLDQQYKVICELLPKYKDQIRMFSGKDQVGERLSAIIEKCRVCVLTPVILGNCLKTGSVSLSSFSMLVFDECHHTRKNEPYNQIMAHYRKSAQQDSATTLPQIIGMTASVGTERAWNVQGAEESILELMARMDVYKIATPQVNKEEYKKYVPDPIRRSEVMKEREADPIKDTIERAMKQLECWLRTEVGGRDKNLQYLLLDLPTKQRMEQQYQSWLSRLLDTLPNSKDLTSDIIYQGNVVAQHLTMYHIALYTNNVLSTKNVVDHLKRSSLKYSGGQKEVIISSLSKHNTGVDSSVSYTTGVDDEGSYTKGVDDEGSYTKGVDDEESYTKGVDDEESYTKGVDDEGSYTKGVDDEESYTKGVDDEGSYTKGVDDEGSYTTGVDDEGSYNIGVDDEGSYNTCVDDAEHYQMDVDNTERNETGNNLTGSEKAGVDDAGSYVSGESFAESDNTGSYKTGVDITGSDNTGVDNTRSYNTVVDSAGSCKTGVDIKGSYNTGMDITGSYNTDPDVTSNDQTNIDNTTVTLTTIYEEVVREVESLSLSQENENPNIVRLQEMVDEIFREKGKDSTFMVFVETRESAKDVSEYLNEKSAFANCYHLISSRSTTEDDERQSLATRTRVVERLRAKELNGLVATPVAEEGLDIPSCNFVIRYNKSSNEISTLQTAGRSRAMQGTVVHFADQQKSRQEEVNVMRLTLMNEALENILNKPFIEIKLAVDKRMCSLTKTEAEEERNRQIQMAAKTQSNFTLRCWQCHVVAVSSCDIRCYMQSQHIVVGREFYNKVKRRLNRKVCQYGGLVKKYKIDCKYCGVDWGIGACNAKNVFFAVLKIKQFIARDDDTGVEYNRMPWTKLPFTVQTMTDEDFASLAGVEELVEQFSKN